MNLKKLKRLNSFFSVGFVIISLMFIGCHKKDRLTSSTFNFGITPPAASVLRTGTLTLNAHGSSSGGSIPVAPTWSISPSGVATLSSNIGTSVIFTPVTLGTAVVTALFDGIMATSQIDVVTFLPNPSAFTVYSDNGLPLRVGISESDIFDPASILTEMTSGYTPEGIKYQRANMVTGRFWGVTLDKNSAGASRDLSSFNGGSLKFSLRLDRTLTNIAGGDHLTIELKSHGSAAVAVDLASGSFGFNRLSTDWQEISIPISSFAGLTTTEIENPFAVAAVALNSALVLDIDAIRWEP